MRALLLLTLLAPLPAAAQEPTGPNVIVTGVPHDYRAELATCLARNCPPDEDIDATLALAEALFLDGEYRGARAAVRAALRRNRGQAGAYPEPVSDLYRVDARLARHLGHDQQALTSTYEILDSLQEGLPQEDHRHFTARLEIIELELRMGRLESARRALRDLEQAARAAGRDDVAALAELHLMRVDYVASPRGSGGARARIEEAARSNDPARRIQATGARSMLSTILRHEGRTAEADALVRQVAGGGDAAPRRRLLYSPPYTLDAQRLYRPGSDRFDATVLRNGETQPTENYEDEWIDVGFWVLPDGHVANVDILRRGAGADWAGPILASIAGRRYSTAGEASYRLERYTFTAGYGPVTGSRIEQRTARPRVEMLDLSEGETPPPTPPAASPGRG
ncbi:MAG: hypothetical protein ACXWUX_09680 [Allosphingosinicella sp.]